MKQPRLSLLVVALSLLGTAYAGEEGAEAVQTRTVRPWTSLRDAGIEKQRLEYSCGMASVATVLNRWYGRGLSEPEMIQAYTADLPEAKLQRIAHGGFSLRDLQLAAAMYQVQCKGYQMTLDGLRAAQGPVLLHLVIKGQKHFCVLGCLTEREILLLDPARGRVRLPIERFLKEWTGYSLVFALPAGQG